VAIRCHDVNILLRAGLYPAGGSSRRFLVDFGIGVAEVRRHCVRPKGVDTSFGLRRHVAAAARCAEACTSNTDRRSQLGNRQREAISVAASRGRCVINQKLCESVKGKLVLLQANSVRVALSNDANRLELFQPERGSKSALLCSRLLSTMTTTSNHDWGRS
jgi:hypothetical protein